MICGQLLLGQESKSGSCLVYTCIPGTAVYLRTPRAPGVKIPGSIPVFSIISISVNSTFVWCVVVAQCELCDRSHWYQATRRP